VLGQRLPVITPVTTARAASGVERLDVGGRLAVLLEPVRQHLLMPVVGGDSGGAPDAIRDGEIGYVVPGRSPYPFLDAHTHGYAVASRNTAAVVVLALIIIAILRPLDRRLPTLTR
jgi:glycosyltransferase involved in cell wall biosynthesis